MKVWSLIRLRSWKKGIAVEMWELPTQDIRMFRIELRSHQAAEVKLKGKEAILG